MKHVNIVIAAALLLAGCGKASTDRNAVTAEVKAAAADLDHHAADFLRGLEFVHRHVLRTASARPAPAR